MTEPRGRLVVVPESVRGDTTATKTIWTYLAYPSVGVVTESDLAEILDLHLRTVRRSREVLHESGEAQIRLVGGKNALYVPSDPKVTVSGCEPVAGADQ